MRVEGSIGPLILALIVTLKGTQASCRFQGSLGEVTEGPPYLETTKVTESSLGVFRV